MTTLSKDTPRDYALGDFEDYPVIASDIIYEGAAVGLSVSGYRPLQAGDPFVGFCTEKADNSSGAFADINVRTRTRGAVVLSISGLAITDFGKDVYASDDNTFTLTKSTNTRIGYVSQWIETGKGVVQFQGVSGIEAALTDSTGGSASDTLAAMTNTTALTDNNGGTADGTVEDVADIALSTSDTYTDAAVNAAVNTAIASISNNFEEVVTQLALQRTLNTALINAVASLAAKVNVLLGRSGQ